jgi:hypothetical protein
VADGNCGDTAFCTNSWGSFSKLPLRA